MNRRTSLLAAAALLALAGCALPPAGKTSPPALELPQAGVPEAPVAIDWWTAFNDPALTTLVTEALEVLRTGERKVVTFGYSDNEAFAVGLTCGGTIHLYLEPLDW